MTTERAGVMDLIEGHDCGIEGTEEDCLAVDVDCVLGSLLGRLVEKGGS